MKGATDATTSKDGNVVIIREYEKAYLWKSNSGKSVIDILRGQRCHINVGHNEQGESIALNPDGKSYFTHSEHVNQILWKFTIN